MALGAGWSRVSQCRQCAWLETDRGWQGSTSRTPTIPAGDQRRQGLQPLIGARPSAARRVPGPRRRGHGGPG